MNIKTWHLVVVSLFCFACVSILYARFDHSFDSPTADVHLHFTNTTTIRFKRRIDIPNQCFPLTQDVSGCLPSLFVLGPSTKENEHINDILEAHSGLMEGNKHSRSDFHFTQQSFDTYFASFSVKQGKRYTFFENSKQYLSGATVPKSIRQMAPTSVFLVPLMNPIDRVISEFYSLTNELPEKCYSIPIEDYIQEEIDLLQQCSMPFDFPKTNWKTNPIPSVCQILVKTCQQYKYEEDTRSFSTAESGSLLATSLYSYHIRHWYSYFDTKQFYITSLQALNSPSSSLWHFLGLHPNAFLPHVIGVHSKVDYSTTSQQTRKWLQKFFSPSIKELYRMEPTLERFSDF